jgi:hypothetical protein
MKHKQATPTNAAPLMQPRRSLRWLDSLMWLGIAGTLAALLVPVKPAQRVSKKSGRDGDVSASTARHPVQPSAVGSTHSDAQESTREHDIAAQDKADLFHTQNPTPVPTAAAGAQTTENTADDSPRVTTGPTLNGPELGNPVPR